MAKDSDYGAFMEKFVLQPSPSAHELPLSGLTFAVKDLSVLIHTLSLLLVFSYTIYHSSLSSKNSKFSYLFSFAFNYWAFSNFLFWSVLVREKSCTINSEWDSLLWILTIGFKPCSFEVWSLCIYILQLCVQASASMSSIVCDFVFFVCG